MLNLLKKLENKLNEAGVTEQDFAHMIIIVMFIGFSTALFCGILN